jgi:hypothetical protein
MRYGVLVFAVLVAACGTGDVDPESISCGMNSDCPAGYECSPRTSHCVKQGSVGTPDARLGTPDARVSTPDAAAGAPDAPSVRTPDAGGGPDAGTTCTPPVITFTQQPPAATPALDATIVWYSTPAAPGFECSLDGAGFAPCTSAVFLNTLDEKAHTFTVRATGSCTSPSGSSVNWTVDHTVPTVTITSGPDEGATTGPSVAFTYSSNEAGASFRCTLDSATADCATTGVSYMGQSVGMHTFSVVAIDAAKNVSLPATRHFIVSTSGPQVTVTAPTGTVLPTFTVTFTVTGGAPGVTTTCDTGAGPKACASGDMLTLADGKYMLVVTAKDMLNQSGQGSTSFTVDGTGPAVSITSPASGDVVTMLDVPVSYNPGDGTRFVCTMNGAPVTCGPSGTVNVNGQVGSNTFTVQGFDTLGNPSDVKSVMFLIDIAGPPIFITTPNDANAGGAGFTCPAGVILFGIDSSAADPNDPSYPDDTATWDCAIDGETLPCDPSTGVIFGKNTPRLSMGSHTLVITATDIDGLQSVAQLMWVVPDATPPSVTIVQPGPGAVVGPSGRAYFTTNDFTASFYCAFDETDPAKFSPCEPGEKGVPWGPYTTSGEHTLRVYGLDACSNRTTPIASRTFFVDATPPVISDVIVDNGGEGAANVTFTITDTNSTVQSVWVSTNGGDFAQVTYATPIKLVMQNLAAGENTVEIYGIDSLGNSGQGHGDPYDHVVTFNMAYTKGAGHVVLLGHDFHDITTTNATKTILHSATSLPPWVLTHQSNEPRNVRVVGWSGAAVDGTEAANVQAVLAVPKATSGALVDVDYTDWSQSSPSAADLSAHLRGQDVLLIYDQQVGAGGLTSLGTAWYTTLQSFLNAGGVVIVLDGLVGAPGSALSDTASLLRAPGPSGEPAFLVYATPVRASSKASASENTDFKSPEILNQHLGTTYYTVPDGSVAFDFTTPDPYQAIPVFTGSSSLVYVVDASFPRYVLNISGMPTDPVCPGVGNFSVGVDPSVPSGHSVTCTKSCQDIMACAAGSTSCPFEWWVVSGQSPGPVTIEATAMNGYLQRYTKQSFLADFQGPSIQFDEGPQTFCDRSNPCPTDTHCNTNRSVCEAPSINADGHVYFYTINYSPGTPSASFSCSVKTAAGASGGTCAVSNCTYPFPLDFNWPRTTECTATYSLTAGLTNYVMTVTGTDCSGKEVSNNNLNFMGGFAP